jgi:hypothetical protein
VAILHGRTVAILAERNRIVEGLNLASYGHLKAYLIALTCVVDIIVLGDSIAEGYKAHILSLPAGYEGYTFSGEDTYLASGQTELTLVATKPAA